MNRRVFPVQTVLFAFVATLDVSASDASARWSEQKANDWLREKPWLVGCNFAPSTAINQLEMWQAETFDTVTIDRELGWARQLGFNSIRVYLHNLLWEQDSEGFTQRLDEFLGISDRHGIGVMFVLLDGVWDPFPKLGRQREPKPHVHNSGWVQSPGMDVLRDPSRHDELQDYVKGVVSRFRMDSRVHAWDIFNEPDNINAASYGAHEPENKPELALALLKKAYAWARQASPSQPITTGLWTGDWSSPEKLSPLNRFMLEQSDIISFHCYSGLADTKSRVEPLKRYNRPVLCTEYMSRPTGCTFQEILPYLKQHDIAAYNWGLVAGKTQTIYPWSTWEKPYSAEPPVWFHDILRKDGTPFDPREMEFIKGVTVRSGQ